MISEITAGWEPLDGIRMGAGHQKDRGMITGLELSSLPLTSGEGVESELITNDQWLISHSCIVKPTKTLKSWGSELQPTLRCGRVICPKQSLNSYLALYMTLRLSLSCVLYNKLVIVSKCSPEFCALFQQIIKPETEEGLWDSPDFVAMLDRSVGKPGTWHLWLKRGQSGGTEPLNLCSLKLTLGSECQNWVEL